MKRLILVILCLVSLASIWPVDQFCILDAERCVFSAKAPPGQHYRTRYVHSVQLTPVLDEYIILSGRIWQWRESVLSHNAGLPFSPPAGARFLREGDWMIIEGAHASWSELAYRVGTEDLGRNILEYPPYPPVALFLSHPGRRLRMHVDRVRASTYSE